MNPQVQHLQQKIEILKHQIMHHPVYASITSINDVRIFMKYHVFAVWDFMSLLKSLQQSLTCVEVPWIPVGTADTRYLINEIVVGEESDVDESGNRISHFELYVNAMQQCGADVAPVMHLISELQSGKSIAESWQGSHIPEAAKSFMQFTFDIIHSKKVYLQSAIFTFGREDLIPGMFVSMIKELHAKFPNEISIFKYYIERHIDVDGDHHSHLALQMTSQLCDVNPSYWQEAEQAVIKALEHRRALWDAVYQEIIQEKMKRKEMLLS